MRKYLLGILLLLISIFSVPNTTYVKAENLEDNEIVINTLYPNGVLDYQNLTSISQVSVNNNYIAYTLDNTSLTILNKVNRKVTSANNFTYIYDIKFVENNQLIIVDYSSETSSGDIKIITIESDDNLIVSSLNINLSNLKLIDIYENNDKVLIGIICDNNQFKLYEIENKTILTNPDLIYSTSSTYYNTATQLVINAFNQFVVYDNEGNSRILVKPHSSTVDNTPMDMLGSVRKLKYYNNGTNEYLLAFAEENLYLLSGNNYTSPIKYFANVDMKLEDFTDIDIFSNEIVICDSIKKLIRTFTLEIDESQNVTLKDKELLLSSSDSSLGRFNNASDIFIQGNVIYVSDTKNNRIQIIDNLDCYEIKDIDTDATPHNVLVDNNQNIYFTITNTENSTSTILKYTQDNKNYLKVQTYSSYNETSLGLISDSTIDNKNNIYLIDYSNNNLLLLTSAGLQLKHTFTNITTDANTRIEFLKNYKLLVIYNGSMLYLINPETLDIIDSLLIDNCRSITVDYSNIYTLSDNVINFITVSDNTMHISEKSLSNDNFYQFKFLTFDIANNLFYAFNNQTQSINYFVCNLSSNPFSFESINNVQPLTNNPTAINIINNGIIYDQPYYLGNYYSNINTCIGIDEFEEFYRVLFNYNNSLQVGFLNKNYASIQEHNTTKKIRVLATNLQVPVYKYPTILKYNDQAVITEYIPINTYINITYNSFPISIDDKQFYLYTNDGKIGYIFNADIVLDDSKNITYLNSNNATISAIGKDEIYIFAEDKITILATLNNSDRIYVENYDKNSEYTLVTYKDDNLNTIKGYVKTDYIEMDKLDNNRIVLIILIVLSVVILCVITISYIIIKKRK
ncbi:MAG: hypothetical protein ACI4PF_00765 [Christensenellales bacterium]